MAFFRSLITRVVREFASDPENQEKAKKLYSDEVAPRAKDFWQKAEPDVKKAGKSALRGAAKAAVEIKKRWKETDRES
jgi:hypothetical protein